MRQVFEKNMSDNNLEKSENFSDKKKHDNSTSLSSASQEFYEILSDVKEITAKQNVENYSDAQYYNNAKKYWSSIEADDDGMLGGFAKISFCDIQASTNFLHQIFRMKPAPMRGYCLDCGAGIGRISKNLLINFFDKVDLVEQDARFCSKARESLERSGHLGEIFNVGLQEFEPETGKYDVRTR